MTTFLSVSKPSRVGAYISPKAANDCTWKVLHSKWGISWHLGPGSSFELLSGKEAGARLEVLAPTQRGRLWLGIVVPKKMQVMCVVNPRFHELAAVGGPTLAEPGEITELSLVVSAFKAVDLADWANDWIMRCYAVE